MIELADLCRPLVDVEAAFLAERDRDPILASLDALWSRGGVLGPDDRVVATRHSVGRRDGMLLWGLAAAVAPAASIETGFAYGVSTACLIAGVPGVAHTSIDPLFRTWAGAVGLEHWRKLGLSFELIEQPSEYALPQLLASQPGRRIQFAYIDGLHTFDGALIDFFYLDRMLDPGGLMILHDANAPAIETLVAFVASNRRYRVSSAYAPTIAVCQKMGDDDRRWDHFVPFAVAARTGWDRR